MENVNNKKDIIKRIITILLGLCIALARIVYPTHVNITKMTVFIEFIMELAICTSIVLINRKEIKEILSQKNENKESFFNKVITIWAIMLIGTAVLNLLVELIYNAISTIPLSEAYDPAAEIGDIFSKTFFLPVLLVQCILAPIEEELVFRYSFRKIFNKNNIIIIILYVLLSSWLFGFIHSASLIAPGMISYICTGIVLALAYLKYKDIRLLICAHIFYNSLLWVSTLIHLIF